MKRLILLAAFFTICCMAPPPEKEIPLAPSLSGNCNPEAAKGLIGKPGTAELAAEAQKLSGASRTRWLRPGTAVTMDFSPGRLNIELDDKGNVIGFRCG